MQYKSKTVVSTYKILYMKRILLHLPLWIILVFAISSCKPKDLTPAYLEIGYYDVNYNPETGYSPLDVSTFNETHGENYDSEQLKALMQHHFTHVNVYVEGKNLGCWKLPCKIPVLDFNANDSSNVIILPAFPLNGMTNTIQGYPFFNVLRKNLLLKRGETFKVSDSPLKFIYNNVVHIPFLETFANSSPFTPSDTVNSHYFFQPTTLEGRSVGEIVLHSAEEHFDVHTVPITLPVHNYYVYLEMTYKAESNMEIGLKISTADYSNYIHEVGGVYASDGEWKTVCFRLNGIINDNHNTNNSVTQGTLVLTGIGNEGGDTHFYIDNIKIIYSPKS